MCQTPEEVKLFDQIVAKIEHKHDELGHTLGCSFLYTPKKTFTGGARIVFLGINPGGAKREDNVPSVERGNAHHSEPWGANGKYIPVQIQVQQFYKLFAEQLNPSDKCLWKSLMDETLQSNFIPFRSPDVNHLHEAQKSRSFACALWKEIFSKLFVQTAPRVIIWHGVGEFDRYSGQILCEFEFKKEPSGWYRRPYREGWWSHNGQKVYVLGVPQLSRCGIITSQKCTAAVKIFTNKIANALR